MAAINIGSAAIDRASTFGFPSVLIAKDNPATATGVITSIEIYAVTGYDISDCKVATFYSTGTNQFSTRAYATLGTITGGSKQTFTGLSLACEAGDYIGIYGSATNVGRIELDLTTGAGVWGANTTIPCTNTDFGTVNANYIMSLYATGISFINKTITTGIKTIPTMTRGLFKSKSLTTTVKARILQGLWLDVAPQSGVETIVLSTAILNNEVYGGTSPSGKLLKWNDTDSWIVVAPQYDTETDIVALAVLNSEIYGATSPSGKLLKWNGTNAWTEVAPQFDTDIDLASLIVLNGEIYGGTSPYGKLLKWNGTNAWTEVAPQLSAETIIESLAILSGEIYGSTYPSGKLLKWNSTNAWVEIAPQSGSETIVLSLAVLNGEIYGSTGANGKLLKWNGSNAWVEVAPQFNSDTFIFSIAVLHSEIYGSAYPSGKLLKWNGSNAWVEVFPQMGIETVLFSLTVLNNELYSGTHPSGNLLKWNGISALIQKNISKKLTDTVKVIPSVSRRVLTTYDIAILADSRTDRITGTITLEDATVLNITDADIVEKSLYVTDQIIVGESIEIGQAIASELGISLYDNTYSYTNAVLNLSYGIIIGYTGETPIWEDVALGVFNVTKINRMIDKVELKAMDNMILLKTVLGATDVSVEPPKDLITNACATAGVTLTTTDFTIFPNYGMTLTLPSGSNVKTCWDLVMWSCQILSAFARISTSGGLEILPLHSAIKSEILSSQRFAPTTISDTTIKVTGIEMQVLNALYDEGTSATMLTLESNALLESQTTGAIGTALTAILADITQAEYTPFTTTFFGDPKVHSGDWVTLPDTSNLTGSATGIVTHSTWKYRGRHSLRSAGKEQNVATKDVTQLQKEMNTMRQDILIADRIITGSLTSADSKAYFDLDSRAIHMELTNGDLVELTPAGLYRHVSATDHDYHYLIATGSVSFVGATYPYAVQTVTLPSEFQDKDFTIVLSISSAGCWIADYAIQQIVCDVQSTNKAAGTFVIAIAVISINTDGTDTTDLTGSMVVTWVAIV